MSRWRVIVVSVWLLGIAAEARAQDGRSVGLVMAAPAQAGLLWQVTDRVAVRPTVSFSWSSVKAESSADIPLIDTDISITGSRVSPGVHVLFYLGDADDVRTYVAPGYTLARSTTSTDSTFSIPGFTEDETESDTDSLHIFSALFGAEHDLGSRFRLFGEFGFAFSSSSSTSGLVTIVESSRKNLSTTGGVGVVWLF